MIHPDNLVPSADLFMKAAQEILNESKQTVHSSGSLFANELSKATNNSLLANSAKLDTDNNRSRSFPNSGHNRFDNKPKKPNTQKFNSQNTFSPFGYPYNNNNFNPFYSNFPNNYNNFANNNNNNFGYQPNSSPFFNSFNQTGPSNKSVFNNRTDYVKAKKAQVCQDVLYL